jgi:hypothetical protein
VFSTTFRSAPPASSYPLCTKQALNAAARSGATPLSASSGVFSPWGCAGGFAFGNFDIEGNDATLLFIADGHMWEIADRGKYCESHTVPAKIYQPACEVN